MKILSLFLLLFLSPALMAADLPAILAGEHRSEANRARDVYRHPHETLRFFRVQPDMTVVEIWPGGGWYTEILAPYLKEEGTLYAAHFPEETEVAYFQRIRAGFEDKLAAEPAIYGEVVMTEFDPAAGVLTVPPGSADRVLTFRNVHNWLRSDSEAEAFELFFRALKPGGMLGVVEHRSGGNDDRQWMTDSGYMAQDYVVALAEKAGFRLVSASEINANPADTADHPRGVWTLPPSLRMGEENRQQYLDIGESDRMTLLFIKPSS